MAGINMHKRFDGVMTPEKVKMIARMFDQGCTMTDIMDITKVTTAQYVMVIEKKQQLEEAAKSAK